MTHLRVGITAERPAVIEAVRKAGADPVLLGRHSCHESVAIDALVLPGNKYDVPPSLYGEEAHPHTFIDPDQSRTTIELYWVKRALEENMPLLGICGGMQMINVVLGGSLVQHLPDEAPGDINHRQSAPFTIPGHDTQIFTGSRLHHLMRTPHAAINSDHHQAIDRVGHKLDVTAIAPDGVVEAFEHSDHRFLVGVQWHPEHYAHPNDAKLFDALVEAATARCLSHVSATWHGV